MNGWGWLVDEVRGTAAAWSQGPGYLAKESNL